METATGIPRSRRRSLSRVMETQGLILSEISDNQAADMLAWISGAFPEVFDAAYRALPATPCEHTGVFARGPDPGTEYCARCDQNIPRAEL